MHISFACVTLYHNMNCQLKWQRKLKFMSFGKFEFLFNVQPLTGISNYENIYWLFRRVTTWILLSSQHEFCFRLNVSFPFVSPIWVLSFVSKWVFLSFLIIFSRWHSFVLISLFRFILIHNNNNANIIFSGLYALTVVKFL